VAGDPAGVGGAPVAVLVLDVEDVLQGRVDAGHVAAVGVDQALGLPGGAGGVEDEERIVALHHLRGADGLRQGQLHELVVPVVAPRLHPDLVGRALDDDHRFHRGGVLDRVVDDLLELDDLAVHEAAVGGEDHARLRVLDSLLQRVHAEAAIDHRVDGADLRGRQHGDHDLRDAGHVDGDPVALANAHGLEHVGELADVAVERVVRVGPDVALLAHPHQRQLVAPPGLLVPVERVVDDVALRAGEPLVEGLLGVVEHLVPLPVPLELLGLGRPEAEQVVVRLPGERVPVLDAGLGQDLRGGVEDFTFQRGSLLAHRRILSVGGRYSRRDPRSLPARARGPRRPSGRRKR
jgi:hypothetical protein